MPVQPGDATSMNSIEPTVCSLTSLPGRAPWPHSNYTSPATAPKLFSVFLRVQEMRLPSTRAKRVFGLHGRCGHLQAGCVVAGCIQPVDQPAAPAWHEPENIIGGLLGRSGRREKEHLRRLSNGKKLLRFKEQQLGGHHGLQADRQPVSNPFHAVSYCRFPRAIKGRAISLAAVQPAGFE